MRCQRCQRVMSEPAVTIQSRAGVRGYGPKCARLMGLIEPTPGKSRAVDVRGAADPAQMPLEFEVVA